MISLDAPILPWTGMGGIKLNTHISEYYDVINKNKKVIVVRELSYKI